MREIQVALTKAGHRVFRNNIGVCLTKRGDYIRYGVCHPGGSDLIGWTADGRFLAVEVKSDSGRVTTAQADFLLAVRKSGGVGILARSTKDIEII